MKTSSILVCPVVPLRQLPPAEVDVIRRFLFDHIRGMDAKHEKRWRRLWSRIWNAAEGEGVQVFSGAERSLRFHKRWMAIERRIFENQDAFVNLERFRDYLKTGAGFGTYALVGDAMRFVPGSVSFDEASDDEMREFTEAAVEFLHTDRCQRRLWKHLPKAKRDDMVEALLQDPKEQEQ